MRWMTRLVVVTGLAGVVSLGGPQAQADVVFAESAQEAFGVDENGEPTGPGNLSKMWEAFIAQEEGRRILEKLEESDATITIEVLPDEHVGDGKAYGTTQGFDWEGDRPNRIEIKLARDGHKGLLEGADTIHHEMRHAEIKLDGGHVFAQTVFHDLMHAGVDTLNNRFQSQLNGYITEVLERDPFYLSETPIYDSIKARSYDLPFLRFTALDIGNILDPGPTPRANIVEVNGVRISSAIATEIDGAALPGSGCGTSEGDRTIICPEGAGVMDLDDLLGIGVQLDSLEGLLDSSIEVRIELDADGDPANNRQSQSETDTSGGTDTTIGALYDPTLGWSMSVFGAQGAIPSDARAIVESDSVTFLVPMNEVPGGTSAGFRVAVEDTLPDGSTLTDVLGATASESLAPVPDGPVQAGCGQAFLGPVCGAQSQANISGVFGHVDLDGDRWVEMVFEGLWAMVPPNDLPSLAVFYNISTESGSSGGRWSIHEGSTFGIGTIGEEAVDVEMFLSPWGTVFFRVPGGTETGGFSPGAEGPLLVNTLTRHLLTLDGEVQERLVDFPLTTARISTGFEGPGADWTAVAVDVGVVTLVIPEG